MFVMFYLQSVVEDGDTWMEEAGIFWDEKERQCQSVFGHSQQAVSAVQGGVTRVER